MEHKLDKQLTTFYETLLKLDNGIDNTLNASKKFIDVFCSILTFFEKSSPEVQYTASAQKYNDYLSNIIAYFQKIEQSAVHTPISKIEDEYYKSLLEYHWPLFCIDDVNFSQTFITLAKNNAANEDITKLVFDYCSNEYLEQLEQKWKNTDAINSARFPILSEALLTYKKDYFYTSTSTLVCQIYGIISDIISTTKQFHAELSESDQKEVLDQFEIEQKTLASEKGHMLQAIYRLSPKNYIKWCSLGQYLLNDVLCSSESKKRFETQPLRNKICHGVQLNFGTKEHALKSILIIDALITVAAETNTVLQNPNN